MLPAGLRILWDRDGTFVAAHEAQKQLIASGYVPSYRLDRLGSS